MLISRQCSQSPLTPLTTVYCTNEKGQGRFVHLRILSVALLLPIGNLLLQLLQKLLFPLQLGHL